MAMRKFRPYSVSNSCYPACNLVTIEIRISQVDLCNRPAYAYPASVHALPTLRFPSSVLPNGLPSLECCILAQHPFNKHIHNNNTWKIQQLHKLQKIWQKATWIAEVLAEYFILNILWTTRIKLIIKGIVQCKQNLASLMVYSNISFEL